MAVKLHTDPLSYVLLGQSCNAVFSRDATKALLGLLAERGFRALGVDGGVYSNGVFEPRIDAAQSWSKAISREHAHTLHMRAIRAMEEDPEGYNGYAITTVRIG
jgi:hypothetical protein